MNTPKSNKIGLKIDTTNHPVRVPSSPIIYNLDTDYGQDFNSHKIDSIVNRMMTVVKNLTEKQTGDSDYVYSLIPDLTFEEFMFLEPLNKHRWTNSVGDNLIRYCKIKCNKISVSPVSVIIKKSRVKLSDKIKPPKAKRTAKKAPVEPVMDDIAI